MDDRDRFRFVYDLFEFNDLAPANHSHFYFNPATVGQRQISRPPRKLLVSILAFCLMPNHYHLLLQPLVENGVPLFMKKLNGGYVQYFNKKHKRTGTLFERKYKSVLVNSHAHFIHLPYYIHLNVLDLVAPEWRQKRIENLDSAKNFLNHYRWSSHLDYTGEKNFPSVTRRDFLLGVFEGEKGYKKKMKDWLKELSVQKMMGDFVLE